MCAVPRRSLRLTTERLTIRPLARQDITEFTRYRNLPDVARYQDWTLPYTRDLAHALVDDAEELGVPTPGQWLQLAVTDDDDRLLGDVAVWLDDAALLAMIGYTLAPESQGQGYAAEAVEAVVDWLFAARKVHRVAATIDPENLASARVLERNGFRYIGTARSAALVRGVWSDDARFEILADEWRAWKRRPGPATSRRAGRDHAARQCGGSASSIAPSRSVASCRASTSRTATRSFRRCTTATRSSRGSARSWPTASRSDS